jgi:hypothetical protein
MQMSGMTKCRDSLKVDVSVEARTRVSGFSLVRSHLCPLKICQIHEKNKRLQRVDNRSTGFYFDLNIITKRLEHIMMNKSKFKFQLIPA